MPLHHFHLFLCLKVVKLDVCRGYPLPFDPDDPNTEIVTTVAVNSPDNTADLNSNTTDKLRHATISFHEET